MALWLKQSTSVDVGIGPFLDSSDGFTAETALTLTQPDIRLKKNSGNWAQKNAAQTLSHEENGWYELTLDATDTNTLGILLVSVQELGALPVWHEFQIVSANIYDSFIGGGDVLDVNAVQWLGTNLYAPVYAGLPDVNLLLYFGGVPNTLIGGRVPAHVGAMANNVITSDIIAADAIGASELAADAVTEIADAILKRDMGAVSGESARSLLNAIRKLMNKWSISGTVLTVTKEDDSTTAYTQNITSTSNADAITGLDTN